MNMPFYEYECPNCGYRDEVLQKITDKPLTKCPSCGKSSLRKLMSAPVFRLKGSGWYETDFKSDKDNKRNLAGPEKEEPKAETKTEATPAAKTETKTDAKSEAKKPEAPAAPAAKPVEKASKSASKSAARLKTKAKARKPRR